uniref:Uncharacterized protein n=1 Tax=Rhinopithecus bieti TaxID=61621 RepID=A0A2K6KFN4_RHIBE
MKEEMVQAEEVAAEIARKLEKQEKKCLKKEKKWLVALALISSENSSSTPEECEGTSENPKEEKVPQENGMEDPSISFSKPKKKKSFSKEELMSSDLEETTGSTSLPKRKKSSPKEETVNDPEEAGHRSGSKKKRKFSKEEPVSSGPEEAAGKSSSPRRRKSSIKHPRKIRMQTDILWEVGHTIAHGDISQPVPCSPIKTNSHTHTHTKQNKNSNAF